MASLAQAPFQPGVHRHYKGGTYTALGLASHHETDEVMVLYVSHTYGKVRLRELASPGKDSWTDVVTWPDGTSGPRFRHVGDSL
jgi:hypothetical protein